MSNTRHGRAASAAKHDIAYEQTPEGATKVVLTIDGAEASRAYIIPLTIHIGTAMVRMDGIGGVATAEEHRTRGYSRRVLDAAIERMGAGDAALTTLYGITDFYPKFGYATCGPDYVLRLTDLSHFGDVPPGWHVRAVTEADLPAVHRLYAQNTAQAAGAVVREPTGRAWSRLAKSIGGQEECRVVIDPSCRIVAYLWHGGDAWFMRQRKADDPKALAFGEVMVESPAAADAAIAAGRRWAAETGRDRINLAQPPEGPVATAAMLHDARVESYFTRAGDFMGRILDLNRFFDALRPELSARVRAARPNVLGELRIATDEGVATLLIERDGVTLRPDDNGNSTAPSLVAEMPQHQLARLAFGAFPPAELLARLPTPPDAQTTDLLTILFPQRHPHISPMDRF